MMDLALEFLSGPRVLVVRLYQQPVRTDISSAVRHVTRHGCYEPGVPLLIDVTQLDSWEEASDFRVLRQTITAALPESQVAVVVSLASDMPDDADLDVPVFTSRSHALYWLAPEWDEPRPRVTRPAR